MQDSQNMENSNELSSITKKLENKLNYQNPKLLALFMDNRKKILSRNITGLSFQQQKKIK
jgi:ribosomal protein S18